MTPTRHPAIPALLDERLHTTAEVTLDHPPLNLDAFRRIIRC